MVEQINLRKNMEFNKNYKLEWETILFLCCNRQNLCYVIKYLKIYYNFPKKTKGGKHYERTSET